jgi:CheY-like chemotaxis protein
MEAAMLATPTPNRHGPERPRAHVLIVDDEPANHLICSGYCDLFDDTCEGVRTGAEAIAAVKSGRFDVVLMNIHLQDMSGLEAICDLRSLAGAAAETPVIGVTEASRPGQAQWCLAAGYSGVLAKPITAARLFDAISSALNPKPSEPRSWAPR